MIAPPKISALSKFHSLLSCFIFSSALLVIYHAVNCAYLAYYLPQCAPPTHYNISLTRKAYFKPVLFTAVPWHPEQYLAPGECLINKYFIHLFIINV